MVSAVTSVGTGTKSNPLCVATPEKRPTAPQMEVKMDQTDNVVTLKCWPPPGPVVGYRIKYGKTLKKFDSLINVDAKTVDSNVRLSVFDDLDAGKIFLVRNYVIKVHSVRNYVIKCFWLGITILKRFRLGITLLSAFG